MAPLSMELSGLILPHDVYGSHLDATGKTIDEELREDDFPEKLEKPLRLFGLALL